MNFSMTAIFYGLVGISVSSALWLSEVAGTRGERWFRLVTSVIFWPIYLPLLLRWSACDLSSPERISSHPGDQDELATMIDRVEGELDLALGTLHGWSDSVLASEQVRIAELRAAWRAQADRLRELDALLAQPAFAEGTVARDQTLDHPRLARCEQSRLANLARLHSVRERMHEDLIGTLSWVRELVTMIHLAKFTGAPATRAAELVAQIAATVEGLSEASQWMAESESEPLVESRPAEPSSAVRLESLAT